MCKYISDVMPEHRKGLDYFHKNCTKGSPLSLVTTKKLCPNKCFLLFFDPLHSKKDYSYPQKSLASCVPSFLEWSLIQRMVYASLPFLLPQGDDCVKSVIIEYWKSAH